MGIPQLHEFILQYYFEGWTATCLVKKNPIQFSFILMLSMFFDVYAWLQYYFEGWTATCLVKNLYSVLIHLDDVTWQKSNSRSIL